MSRITRAAVAAATAVALVVPLSPTPGHAAVPGVTTDEMTAVPSVVHVPRTESSYPFAAADHARIPLDLASYGYVEEEYFLSGYANVYTKADGSLAVQRADVPYTNRILVRRPAKANRASGVVVVDIYNASNGYDIEDMWRRLYTTILGNRHTYVGVTSKPINVDALYHFDWERYQDLSWADDESCTVAPMPFVDPFQEVPCTETGLAWDIITQTGNALRDRATSRQLLGGANVKSLLLVGQSQSSMYLNTYVNNFHLPLQHAVGGNVWDGYLSAAGNWIERPLNDADGGASGMLMLDGPATPVDVDVPWISVDTEGDVEIFPTQALMPRDLDADTRVWQVPGTAHTYSWSPVVQDNAELIKAGRPARVFPSTYTPYPGEPAMFAALQALVDADRKGKSLPASRWFERNGDDLVRDARGNALGGVRSGLLDLGLGQFLGSGAGGPFNGEAIAISADEFHDNWNKRKHYLAKQRAFDNKIRRQGYLTSDGQALFAERANVMMDRIGIR